MTSSGSRLIENPRFQFLTLALVVNVAVSLATHAVRNPARLAVVEVAGAFDLILTVGALYYLIVVRRGFRSPYSLIGVVLLGLLRAAFAFPRVVPGKEFIAGVIECGVVAALIVGFRRSRESDPAARFQSALAGILPFESAERALSGELTVLYYAFAWRARPHLPEGAAPFTFHKRSGFKDLLWGIALASLFEIPPVHLIVQRRSALAAWLLTAASVYGAIWLASLARSLDLRPGFIQNGQATVRFGLFFSLRFPASAVRAVSAEAVPGAFRVGKGAEPNLWIEFSETLTAERMMGLRKPVRAISLTADEPDAFAAALRQMAY